MPKSALLVDWLARRRNPLAVLLLLSLALPIAFLPRLAVDNSIEVWLDQDSPAFRQYQLFLDRYGSEEFIVVAAETETPFSESALHWQGQLADALRKIQGVEQVLDLPTVCTLLYPDRNDWPRQARQNPLFRNLLLGTDGKTVGIIIWLKSLPGPEARRNTVRQIQQTVPAFVREYHLVGTPVLNVALDSRSQQVSRLFLPIALALSVLVLALALRSLRATAVCMFSVAVGVVWTMGLMAALGKSLNMVTVVLPSLLFVLILSNAIHLALRFRYHLQYEPNQSESVRKTLADLIRPAVLSAVTTSIGFSSLLLSDMQPVADFGLLASLGMLVSLPCNLILVPTLSALVLRPGNRHSITLGVSSNRLQWFSAWVVSKPRLLPIVGLAVLVVCVSLFTQLKVESNVVKFFPDDSRITQDYTYVANRLTGLYSLELDFQTDTAHEAVLQEHISRLSERIETRPEVARVNHLGQLYQSGSALNHKSLDVGNLAQLGQLGAYLTKKYRFQNDNSIHLRASVLVRAMDSGDFYTLIDFIHSETGRIMPDSVQYELTGVVRLLNDVQQRLIVTQVKCFSLAAGVVLLLIGVFTFSVRAALASALPNMLPVCVVFGLMALTGIALDPATVMIASVAIGLAVDDTIHFLTNYQREKQAHRNHAEAVGKTIEKIGRAMVFTSLVAATGFCILLLAPFRPLVYFGLLTAVTIVAALVADLLLMPGCLQLFKVWNKDGNDN